MKSEVIAEKTLAYVRVTGPYGENYESALDNLYQWAGERGLQNGQCLFIYHDDPDFVPAEKCTTDLCLTVPAATTAEGDIHLQSLPPGKYCVMRKIVKHKSEYKTLWGALKKMVKELGLQVDDRPCFELYHSYDVDTHMGDVGFYLAVKDK